jgi:hypothetical protein
LSRPRQGGGNRGLELVDLLLELCTQLFETGSDAGNDEWLPEQGVELIVKLGARSQQRITMGETLEELGVDRRGRGPVS